MIVCAYTYIFPSCTKIKCLNLAEPQQARTSAGPQQARTSANQNLSKGGREWDVVNQCACTLYTGGFIVVHI